MIRGLIVASLLFFGSFAHATDFVVPTQKIVGAETVVPPGEVIILSISEIDKKPPWLMATSYKWKILDRHAKDKRTLEHDGSVVFGSGMEPTTTLAMCAVTHLYVVKDEANKIVEVGTRTVFLFAAVSTGPAPGPGPGPGPGPNPPPNPPPSPDPVFPQGKYGLSKSIYDLAKKTVSPSATRQSAAKALADSFRGIASSIAAGTLQNPTDILKQTTASNQSALKRVGVSRDEWDACFRGLQDAIFSLWDGQSVNTADDFRTAWLEISSGLEAIK